MFADPNPYDCDGPVIFADAYLKAAVEAALGVTDPNATDMLALTFLTVDERGIADLTGLEYATNLTYLNLVINEISDISPLAGLTNLSDLDLGANAISDICSLWKLVNLRSLYIG